MARPNGIAKLRHIQSQADAIREKLSISKPGEVIYMGPLDVLDNDIVIVEADGFGGAWTKVVEGNYPLDFLTHFEKKFSTEDAACAAADQLAEGEAEPTDILGKSLSA